MPPSRASPGAPVRRHRGLLGSASTIETSAPASRGFPLSAVALLLACCTGEPGPHPDAPNRSDVSSSTAALSIGAYANEGDGVVFGEIETLDVDREGRIYVIDKQALEVRAFSAQGVPLGRAGGPGSGPGEFRAPLAVRPRGTDTIEVLDGPLKRIATFALGRGGLRLTATMRLEDIGLDFCEWSGDQYVVLWPSQRDEALLRVVDRRGHTLRAFGTLLSELPPKVEAMRYDARVPQTDGPLVCSQEYSTLIAVSSELGYVRAYDIGGRELWRTRLRDFHPLARVPLGTGRWVAQMVDPDLGYADYAPEAFLWARDTLAIAVRRDEPATVRLYEMRLLTIADGVEVARYQVAMVVAAADVERAYGYVNEPIPRVLVMGRRDLLSSLRHIEVTP